MFFACATGRTACTDAYTASQRRNDKAARHGNSPLSGEMRRCAENVKYFRGAAALTGNPCLTQRTHNGTIRRDVRERPASCYIWAYVGESSQFAFSAGGLDYSTDEKYCYTVFVYIKITDVSCIFGQHVVI